MNTPISVVSTSSCWSHHLCILYLPCLPHDTFVHYVSWADRNNWTADYEQCLSGCRYTNQLVFQASPTVLTIFSPNDILSDIVRVLKSGLLPADCDSAKLHTDNDGRTVMTTVRRKLSRWHKFMNQVFRLILLNGESQLNHWCRHCVIRHGWPHSLQYEKIAGARQI